MPHPRLHLLPAFARVREAFARGLPAPPDLPPDLAALAGRVATWDDRCRRTWHGFETRLVARRVVGVGIAIADAIRLQREVRTRRIDDWLATAPETLSTGFDVWRDEFFVRCDALAELAIDGLIASDLVMPEGGALEMVVSNPVRLGHLVGGRRYPFATVGVYLGAIAVVVREWDFFASLAGRQLRRAGLFLTARKWARVAARLNSAAGKVLITNRHVEALREAYDALKDRGVTGAAADTLVIHALERGHWASGKPWKGLSRLTELMVFSGIDPAATGCPALFDATMDAPVDYTHVPGREWIVRDYALGKRLMQIDGKIAPGDRLAGLQQGRGSLATGYLRGGHNRTEFGRRYSKPLQAFLDSMVVAEGPDHQRQRKAFLPFFSQSAVLAHAEFVESTVAQLVEKVSRVARQNEGRFDFRNDFAYHFPIRIICRLLDLPAADVPAVQHWAESSVRAMDTEAGVSFTIARDGQQASDQLRAYLEQKLALARNGTFAGEVIGIVARDATLSEPERIANLGVVIFAGFETTTGLLSKGLEALLRHRDQWTHLAASLVSGPPIEVGSAPVPDREWRWLAWALGQPERGIDRDRRDRLMGITADVPLARTRFEAIRHQEELLDRAVEEMLRWTAPGTVVPLTASKDLAIPLEAPLDVKGKRYGAGDTLPIRRGETIAVAVDELNRRCPISGGTFDPAVAGGFDVTRTDNTSHLSFGLRHACIGAFLAKENAKRALEGVLRQFPGLELDGDPIPQEMELFSGLASLPVRAPMSDLMAAPTASESSPPTARA